MESIRVSSSARSGPQGTRAQCVVQYTSGTNVQNAGVTNIMNTQDSQEEAPRATNWFLGLMGVGKLKFTGGEWEFNEGWNL
eukprot:1182920-Prorocentrum_minimum.AAC.5